VTDANLVLGRLRAEDFPSIFGESNDQPLDVNATRAAFEELTAEINTFLEAQAVELGMESKTMTAAQVGSILQGCYAVTGGYRKREFHTVELWLSAGCVGVYRSCQ
jgi:N-methylhydantoinase A/oxoprolinase/acetone carboxylase beta subunit